MDISVFSRNERYAIVNILSMIMEADTVIHPKEIEYMDSVFVDFSITIDDNEHMYNMDMPMCLSIIKNMATEKQKVAKEMFSVMVAIDGYIDPREKKLLDSL